MYFIDEQIRLTRVFAIRIHKVRGAFGKFLAWHFISVTVLLAIFSSLLWHKFHEDIIMQTRKNLL